MLTYVADHDALQVVHLHLSLTDTIGSTWI